MLLTLWFSAALSLLAAAQEFEGVPGVESKVVEVAPGNVPKDIRDAVTMSLSFLKAMGVPESELPRVRYIHGGTGRHVDQGTHERGLVTINVDQKWYEAAKDRIATVPHEIIGHHFFQYRMEGADRFHENYARQGWMTHNEWKTNPYEREAMKIGEYFYNEYDVRRANPEKGGRDLAEGFFKKPLFGKWGTPPAQAIVGMIRDSWKGRAMPPETLARIRNLEAGRIVLVPESRSFEDRQFNRKTARLAKAGGEEAKQAGYYAAAYVLKEGLVALETQDATRVTNAVDSLKAAEFWASVGAFSAASAATRRALETRAATRVLPRSAGGFAKLGLPLAAGTTAVQAMHGKMSGEDIARSTAAYVVAGAGVDAMTMTLLKAAGRSTPQGRVALGVYAVSRLTATLYIGEKVDHAMANGVRSVRELRKERRP